MADILEHRPMVFDVDPLHRFWPLAPSAAAADPERSRARRIPDRMLAPDGSDLPVAMT